MKIIKIFLIVSLMAASLSLSARRLHDEVNGGDTKRESLFVLRTNKQLVGARVEVFNTDGSLVTAQRLEKKKMIIDFTDAHLGIYTIRVTKGDQTKDFRYVKK